MVENNNQELGHENERNECEFIIGKLYNCLKLNSKLVNKTTSSFF